MRYCKFIILCSSQTSFPFYLTNVYLGIFTETNFLVCFHQILDYFLNIP